MTRRIMMLLFVVLNCSLAFCVDPIRVVVDGEMSKLKNEEVEATLKSTPLEDGQEVDIVISSTSGDLSSSLHLARELARLRDDKHLLLTAYINEQALGPAAALPFACQKIVTTPTVAWGAVTMQMKETSAFPVVDAEIRALIPTEARLYDERSALCHLFVGDEKRQAEVVTQHELARYPTIHIGNDASVFATTGQKTVVDGKQNDTDKAWQLIHPTPKSWIGRIVINDKKQGISEATWMYVKAAIDHFKEKKPACVILELNTPGGEVYASQKISNALRSLDTKDGIPVIAYVNNWAISAGAMLAYSCRYIVVAPDASMGAATPVFQTAEGMSAAPEKVNSALRSDFANRASFFGRNPDIARAMVDSDVILIRRGGQIVALSSEGELHTGPYGTDELISPKGKLLTLTADQMKEFGVADVVIPKDVAFSPDEEIPQGAPLSSTPFRAIPAFADFSDVPVDTFQMDMKTSIVAFLASPLISSALVFVMMVCFYLEMSAPGVLLPGVVGGVAVVLLLMGSFAQETVTWFEPLCMLIGFAIIAIELTFFPTMGILLLVGGALLLFGLVCLAIPGIQSVRFEGDMLNAAGVYALHRLAWLCGAFLLAVAVIILLSRYLSLKTLRFSGIILEKAPPSEEQTVPIHPGDEAAVVATLRPAGKIERNGQLFDALSDGRYIEEKRRVRVVEVRGNTIVVEPV